MSIKVWECKIIVDDSVELPDGFDFPPRHGAIDAIEGAGIKVLSCFSGWGAELTKAELESFKNNVGEIYYAGLMDSPEDTVN